MNRAHPRRNPPVTAAGLASVVTLILASFTDLTGEQVAAVATGVGLVAAFLAQHFTVPLASILPSTPEEQVAAAENTDNGPRSVTDAVETAALPQDPDTEVT